MSDTRQHDGDLLDVQVLGSFQILSNGKPLSLGPVRQQAVLLRLVLCGGSAITGKEILDGVWGEEVPASG